MWQGKYSWWFKRDHSSFYVLCCLCCLCCRVCVCVCVCLCRVVCGLGGVRECVTICSVPAMTENHSSITCFSLTHLLCNTHKHSSFLCVRRSCQKHDSLKQQPYLHTYISCYLKSHKQVISDSLTHSLKDTHINTESCFVAMKGLLVSGPDGHTEK